MVTFGSNIYKKCIWLDKNILYWRVETGIKATFIMYHFLQGPWIVKFANCFCPLVLLICHNWELLIAYPHRSLCFKKFKTTNFTAFLISNTVVTNHYSHNTTIILNLPHLYLKFQDHLIDLSHSDIQIFFKQQLNWNFKNKFVVDGQYITLAAPLLFLMKALLCK